MRHPIGAQAPNAGKTGSSAGSCLLRLVVLSLIVILPACHKTPPEAALRATIASMQAAAKDHDTSALFKPIADDFAGPDGMDRKSFRQLVTLQGLRSQSLGVRLGPIDVKLYGDRASASFTAALSGGAGWVPDRVQVYEIETGWRQSGGDWTLITASWHEKL